MAFANNLDLAAITKAYQDQQAKGGLVHPTVSQNGVNYDPTYDENPDSPTFGQIKGFSGTNNADYGQANGNKVYDYASYDKGGNLSSVDKTTGGGKWSDALVPLLAATAMMGLPGGALNGLFSGSEAGIGLNGVGNVDNPALLAGGSGGANTLSSIAPFTDSLAGTSLVQPVANLSTVAGGAGGAAAGGSLLSGAGNVATKVATSLIPAILGGGSGGGSGGGTGGNPDINGGDLAKIISGYLDNKNQTDASNKMLDYLKQRQAYNDNMYSAGSPELAAMQQEMDRKDAAAGRNSQYGPRSVDLAGRVAQLKMNANTQLTGNIARYMQDSYKQRAAAPAGLSAAIQGLFGGKISPADLQTIINKITGGGDPNATDAVSTGPDNSRDYDPYATTSVDGSVNNALNNIPGYDPYAGWD